MTECGKPTGQCFHRCVCVWGGVSCRQCLSMLHAAEIEIECVSALDRSASHRTPAKETTFLRKNHEPCNMPSARKQGSFVACWINKESVIWGETQSNDEWKAYQEEAILNDWFRDAKDYRSNWMKRIDEYWKTCWPCMAATVNFIKWKKLVRIVFTLSHGNSGLQRTFSISGKSIGKDRLSRSQASCNHRWDGNKWTPTWNDLTPKGVSAVETVGSHTLHAETWRRKKSYGRETNGKGKRKQARKKTKRSATAVAEKAAQLSRKKSDLKETEKSFLQGSLQSR